MEQNSYRLKNVTELDNSGLAAQVLGEIILMSNSLTESCRREKDCECYYFSCRCDADYCGTQCNDCTQE